MDKLLKTDYMFGSNKSKEFSYYDKKEQYRTIFSLVDHPKERNLDEECKIYARTVLAIRLLRESGYLKYKISNQECRQTDLAVARALYKLNTGFKYNLHSIHEARPKLAVLILTLLSICTF
uniref:Uncharacterized protein n=1 Tax=Lepeophtheirus salmonis TaxID=72036 RepID=A0A0K2UB66_LEPSM